MASRRAEAVSTKWGPLAISSTSGRAFDNWIGWLDLNYLAEEMRLLSHSTNFIKCERKTKPAPLNSNRFNSRALHAFIIEFCIAQNIAKTRLDFTWIPTTFDQQRHPLFGKKQQQHKHARTTALTHWQHKSNSNKSHSFIVVCLLRYPDASFFIGCAFLLHPWLIVVKNQSDISDGRYMPQRHCKTSSDSDKFK